MRRRIFEDEAAILAGHEAEVDKIVKAFMLANGKSSDYDVDDTAEWLADNFSSHGLLGITPEMIIQKAKEIPADVKLNTNTVDALSAYGSYDEVPQQEPVTGVKTTHDNPNDQVAHEENKKQALEKIKEIISMQIRSPERILKLRKLLKDMQNESK